MGNRASIVPTIFKDARSGVETFGVRVYDDEGLAYDNSWDSIPNDDMAVLQKTMQSSDEFISGLLSFWQENERGLYIEQTWYEWDEIKGYFEQTGA
jgi:hypothetical protein